MKDSDSDDLALEMRLALIGATPGSILLYAAGYFLRNAENALGIIGHFWSIPAGAITGLLMPNAWPDKNDWGANA